MAPATAKANVSRRESDVVLLEGIDLKVVDHPIPMPVIGRGTKKGTGIYSRVLGSALKMKATTLEYGLSPHFEWPCDNARQLRSRMTGLQATRKRNDIYKRVFFMQRSNPEENKFTIYIWREE